ncbi:PqqD family protein [Candidatus Margulisiibacteriota bacterium]
MLIVNIDNGCYYFLSKIASFIWNLIHENTNFESIVESITKKYDTTKVNSLKKENIINLKELKNG